jgi:hypothetical protein
MKKALIIILVLISFETYPCTSFILRENNSLYLGKNFDYPIGSDFIFINQRNDIKIGVCIPPEVPALSSIQHPASSLFTLQFTSSPAIIVTFAG